MIDVVRRAADRVGGVPALAERLGVSRQALYQWRRVPADKVVALSRASGLSELVLRPDIFAGQLESVPTYEADFAAWAMQQADALKRGDFDTLDLENLIEEIEDLAKSDRREIESRLTVLLLHLLKLRYQPEARTASWNASVLEQRARIARLIRRSPSLAAYPAETLSEEYDLARKQAAIETELPLDRFPLECPFAIADVLDLDFLPRAADEG